MSFYEQTTSKRYEGRGGCGSHGRYRVPCCEVAVKQPPYEAQSHSKGDKGTWQFHGLIIKNYLPRAAGEITVFITFFYNSSLCCSFRAATLYIAQVIKTISKHAAKRKNAVIR